MSIMENAPDTRAQFEQIIRQTGRSAVEFLSKNLVAGLERGEVLMDGLRLRIKIVSLRHEFLLSKLHRDVLATAFGSPREPFLENGAWTVEYFFSEPWPLFGCGEPWRPIRTLQF